MSMLTKAVVTTILPVKDMARARDFHENNLGLEPKGLVFEDYEFPNLKTVAHVCVLGSEKAAWFKDSEGNYLCVHEGPH